jgi:hypothetical protein
MRARGYHGGFRHPIRAFAVGVTLLVLLFAGFVGGIELGSPPAGTSSQRIRIVKRANGAVRVVTVQQPVVTTVVSNRLRVVRLPGGTERRIVVIRRDGGKAVLGYLQKPLSSGGATTATELPVTVYLAEPSVVTTVVTSVATSTVTTTVTEPPPSSTTSESSPPPSSPTS